MENVSTIVIERDRDRSMNLITNKMEHFMIMINSF